MVGRVVALEFTLTSRSSVIVGPSKRTRTVSRNGLSTNCHVISNVSSRIHVPLATTRSWSGSYEGLHVEALIELGGERLVIAVVDQLEEVGQHIEAGEVRVAAEVLQTHSLACGFDDIADVLHPLPSSRPVAD
jgi:hypothetical protein